MTFNPNAPSNSNSPGVFPAQNRTNMARIKALFNNDHVFNDTLSVDPGQGTDGKHKQVTLINRATPSPGVLPTGTNAILYSRVDSLSRTQLFFYNGLTDVQLTPPDELFPFFVTGSVTIPANGSVVVYADPGFRYAGSAYIMNVTSSIPFNYYSIIRKQSNQCVKIIGISFPTTPTLSYSTNDLMANNPTGTNMNCVFSLIINRIP